MHASAGTAAAPGLGPGVALGLGQGGLQALQHARERGHLGGALAPGAHGLARGRHARLRARMHLLQLALVARLALADGLALLLRRQLGQLQWL